jgi:hypothetical protein
MPFAVNTWKVQNIYFEILMTLYPYVISRCEKGDKKAKEWVSLFTSLGEKLSIEVGTP